MKGLFVHTVYFEDQIREDSGNGVFRKIYSQINTFKEFGIQMDKYNPLQNKRRLIYRLQDRLPFSVFAPPFDVVDNMASYDFIYIRNPTIMRRYLFDLFMRIKAVNPNVVILLEVPTYPFDHEINVRVKWSKKVLYKNDRHIRKNLYKCTDRIITFSQDEEIWGIKTIRLSNAINYEKSRRTKFLSEVRDSTIEIIACAQFCFWHGYDRALQGLANYYDNPLNGRKRILLHVVGDGEELPKYKSFVAEKGLQEHVVFHGTLYGDDLKDIYDKCVIGLDSMGRHRSGVYYNSSLKGKEYLAKGLLVVSGVATELDYDEEYKYYFRVPADDTSIDFEKVMEWMDGLLKKEKLEEIQHNIMEYARKNFDYGVSMKKIIEYLNEKCQP